jgi:hypothetical protein
MSTVRSKVFSQDFDTPTTRTFWVRDDREGYVYDVTDRPGTTGKQVCGGLWNSGYALMATSDTLPAVVRRELARRRRQVQREMSR